MLSNLSAQGLCIHLSSAPIMHHKAALNSPKQAINGQPSMNTYTGKTQCITTGLYPSQLSRKAQLLDLYCTEGLCKVVNHI